jgi:hypothetical protein
MRDPTGCGRRKSLRRHHSMGAYDAFCRWEVGHSEGRPERKGSKRALQGRAACEPAPRVRFHRRAGAPSLVVSSMLRGGWLLRRAAAEVHGSRQSSACWHVLCPLLHGLVCKRPSQTTHTENKTTHTCKTRSHHRASHTQSVGSECLGR